MDPWTYIVILGAAVIGYAYMRPQSTIADKTAVVSDIETALDQFAQELEEENQELLRTISGLKRDLEAEINKLSGRVEALEKKPSPIVLDAGSLPVPAPAPALEMSKPKRAEKKPVPAEEPVITDEPEKQQEDDNKPADTESNIKNRYNHIFELHGQGKSIEYISKKIGMNKGEVQLIIQLARQEEQFRDEG